MKKIIFSLLMLMMSVSHAFADGLSAMLQQGDSIQLFYGPQAFIHAYEAADTTGATITLSPGIFGNGASIEKNNLTIVGNYGLSDKIGETTAFSGSLYIRANNVTIDGIYIKDIIYLGGSENIKDTKIIRSRVNRILYSGVMHYNTVFDQCIIGCDEARGRGVNYTLKNSFIDHFSGSDNSDSYLNIFNCFINVLFRDWYGAMPGYAIFKNNILGVEKSVTFGYPTEFYGNVYAVTSLNNSINYNAGCINENNITMHIDSVMPSKDNWWLSFPINPGLGVDGTVRGPQGGTGFVEYPNIPRITGRTIDSQVDEEGKLNVKISVKAK